MKLNLFSLLWICTITLHAQVISFSNTYTLKSGNNDVERNVTNNALDYTSSDLELSGYDYDNIRYQDTYIQFEGITIPQNAIITDAYIEFTMANTCNHSFKLNISGEIGQSATLPNTNFWNKDYTTPIMWTTFNNIPANSKQITPDIKNLFNMMFPNGLTNANMAFKITGDGDLNSNLKSTFNAYSFNGNSTNAPKLVINYKIPYVNVNAILIPDVLSLPAFSTTSISATVLPENASNKNFVWSSLDHNIAFIDNTGKVYGINTGNTQIIATTHDGDIKAICDVQVTKVPNEVIYKWSGAITPTSAKINAKLTFPTTSARVVASTTKDFSSRVDSDTISISNVTNMMGAFSLKNLKPGTKYYYAIESEGLLDLSDDDIGSFTTPKEGPHSYAFTVGSCNSSSTHPVWIKIKEKDPLFMVVDGDLHYKDPNSTDVNVHRLPYETEILNSPNTRDFFSNYPIAYVWDDHDFSGNDSNVTSIGSNSAKQAYREYVPHYPFGSGIENANSAVYQSFEIGRVRHIMSDLRSEKTSTYLMNDAQLEWFKKECLAAKEKKQMIIWVSSYGITANLGDTWGGNAAYIKQRGDIFKFLVDNKIENLMVVSGDAHAIGIDDGTNTDCYNSTTSTCPRQANSNTPAYPLLHSAAINQSGSIKGIVTNILPMTFENGSGQYSRVSIVDDGGDEITVKITCYRVGSNGVEKELANYSFVRNLNYSTQQVTETAIPFSVGNWKYLDNGSNQGTNWRGLSYSDTSWKTGTTPLGYTIAGVTSPPVSYGTNYRNKYITTYFRKKINLSNISEIKNVSLKLRVDDGAIIYLNGVEIGKYNLSSGATYKTLATLSPDNGATVLTIPVNFETFKNALKEGENVIAVEVHQQAATSSDLYMNLELILNRFIVTPLPEPPINMEEVFLVSPNPSAGDIYISKIPADITSFYVNIYDINQNMVFNKQVQNTGGEAQINISNLSPNTYFLVIDSAVGKKTIKIIKI